MAGEKIDFFGRIFTFETRVMVTEREGVATKVLRRFFGRAADTGSMIL